MTTKTDHNEAYLVIFFILIAGLVKYEIKSIQHARNQKNPKLISLPVIVICPIFGEKEIIVPQHQVQRARQRILTMRLTAVMSLLPI